MAHVFKCGDVVALKSDSPQLTVKEVSDLADGSGQQVTAAWFEDGSFKSQWFYGQMLDLVSSADE